MLVEICGVGVMAGEDNLWPPLSQFVTKIIIIFGTVCASGLMCVSWEVGVSLRGKCVLSDFIRMV